MKGSTFHKRWFINVLILFLYLLISSPVEGGTLKGIVKGKGGQLKKYVRVEIGGPETKTTFTNEQGEFSIKLSGGEYKVKIVERNRSMKFIVEVPAGEEEKEETFELNW